MSNNRQQYDEEFKKNAVQLSYASSRTVKEVADDLISQPNSMAQAVATTGFTISGLANCPKKC